MHSIYFSIEYAILIQFFSKLILYAFCKQITLYCIKNWGNKSFQCFFSNVFNVFKRQLDKTLIPSMQP